MGRSVATHPHAVGTIYFSLFDVIGEEITDPVLGPEALQELVEGLRAVIRERYPSFVKCDQSAGRELRAILENEHGFIVVSDYCELLSLSVVPDEHERNDYVNLSRRWCQSIFPKLRDHLNRRFNGGMLRKVATASNGGALFERR